MSLFYKNGKQKGDWFRVKAGLNPDGVTPQRRAKGYSDFPEYESLVTRGYMERRASGARGGIRYHTTAAGKIALEK